MVQGAMHCALSHIYPITIIKICCNLSYSGLAVSSDREGLPLLPSCINEPWASNTLSPAHGLSLLQPVQIWSTPQALFPCRFCDLFGLDFKSLRSVHRHWHALFLQDHRRYSLYLRSVIMFWLISVLCCLTSDWFIFYILYHSIFSSIFRK